MFDDGSGIFVVGFGVYGEDVGVETTGDNSVELEFLDVEVGGAIGDFF